MTITQHDTCQQLNNRPYSNLANFKKPLTKKRTGYKNFSPNSWETDYRLDVYHVRILDSIHKNEGSYKASITTWAKHLNMARITFIRKINDMLAMGPIVPIIKTKTTSGWQGANHYCINPDYIKKAVWGDKLPKSKKFSESYIGKHVNLHINKPTLNSAADFQWDGLQENEQLYSQLSIAPEYKDDDDAVVDNNPLEKEKIEHKKLENCLPRHDSILLNVANYRRLCTSLRYLMPVGTTWKPVTDKFKEAIVRYDINHDWAIAWLEKQHNRLGDFPFKYRDSKCRGLLSDLIYSHTHKNSLHIVAKKSIKTAMEPGFIVCR